MKKIILMGIVLVLIAGFIVAGGIININKSNEYPKEQKDALTSINLDSYNVLDYEIGTERIERCLKRIDTIEYICETSDENGTLINTTCYQDISRINSCKTFSTNYLNCFEYNMTEGYEEECLTWEKLYYTEQEIINILNGWEEERIKLIANAKINRDARQEKIITREGITTIK